MPKWKRYDPADMHGLLIEATAPYRAHDDHYANDGFVNAQALFCPYYVNLEASLGSDWGVIVNPESTKFGLLVFEHAWCGCPTSLHPEHGWMADHGGGTQGNTDWEIPKSQQKYYKYYKKVRDKQRRAHVAHAGREADAHPD